MSRSGYTEDCDGRELVMWRGAVNSAIRGARGQAFLREMADAMDAMPVKALIAHDLERNGAVCAIGSVGKKRGVDMSKLDPECSERIASTFGIANALVKEIEYENDECGPLRGETDEERWIRVRRWIAAQLKDSD